VARVLYFIILQQMTVVAAAKLMWVLQNSYGGYADRVPDFIIVVKKGVIYTTGSKVMEHGKNLANPKERMNEQTTKFVC
jgi:hypothetical protein